MPGVNTDLVHSDDSNITFEGSSLDLIKSRMGSVHKEVKNARRFWSEDNI